MAVEWTPADYFSLVCVIILSLFAVAWCIKNGEKERNRKVQPYNDIAYKEKEPDEEQILMESELNF